MLKAALLSLSVLAVPTLASAADISFKLINGSSSQLVGFYASPVGVKDWEANMVVTPLEPGTDANATFNDPRDVCDYDLKVEFAELEPVIEQNINLCEISEYTVEDAE